MRAERDGAEQAPARPQTQLEQVAALMRGEPAVDSDTDTGELEGQDEGELEGQDEGEDPRDRPPGDPVEDGEDEDEDEAGEPEPASLATIKDVAKQLGVTNAELNKVTLEMGGHSMTLGELKAKLPELAKLDESRVQFEEAKERHGLEKVDAIRRIHALVDAFPPGSVPQGVMQRLEERHQETLRTEGKLLNEARPEWSDQVYAAAAQKRMHAVAAAYGFTMTDIRSILDHRQILLLQDYANLKDKFDKARAAAKPAPAQPNAGGKAQGQAAASTNNGARRSGRQEDMAQRVARLIR